MDRYLLTDRYGVEHEVAKEVWVNAERCAGFVNTLGKPREPATSSWSTSDTRVEFPGGRTAFDGDPGSQIDDALNELEG